MRVLTISLTLFSAIAFACEYTIPESVKNTLKSAAANAPELELALTKCPDDQRKGMEFLIEHMPTKDAQTLKAEYLLENVSLAYQARNEMPWGKEIPEDIFLNDVIPYASLDESRDSWRKDFYQRFRAIAGDSKSALEALTKINTAIEKETGVQYNTKRRAANQGPAESMQLKMASCTGLSILFVDALRAVGIPARIAGIAMWTNKDGNHNWIEVWLPERKIWQFGEYNPDKAGLDHGWLLADAARGVPGSIVHAIYATSWKKTDKHFPMVWDFDATTVPAVDVTQRYVDLGAKTLAKPGECELRIDAYKTANGEAKREAVTIEVRQFDIVVAKGTTPSATADMNNFLSIRVPQGVRYQVIIPGSAGQKPLAMEEIAPKDKQENLRINLTIP
jgi:transglutaminase-like putative cysteine protease